MALFGVESIIGLLALLSLIPFIILYLIRPRPKDLEVPSLMFFARSFDSKQKKSFLKIFMRDWLFLIQLLILVLASIAVANPYFLTSKENAAKNLALVIDVSASMKTQEPSGIRFEKAIREAKNNLGSRNTIILAKGFPVVALEDKSSSEAEAFLNKLKPSDSRSKIGDAMLLAGEVLGDKEGKVIVVSDFISTEGTPPETAKGVLESKGLAVKLIDIADDNIEENAGIISMEPNDEATTILIKNYDGDIKTAKLLVNQEEKEITLNGRSIESYKFATPAGITRIELKIDDAFKSDNVVYLSVPEEIKIKVVLITNSKSPFLRSALQAYKNVELKVAEPPVLPREDFNVYVFYDVDPSSILAGTYDEIADKVKNGASAVIHAQNNILSLNYGELLPVEISGEGGFGVLEVLQSNVFTKDVEFGKVDKHFISKNKLGAVTIVESENSSIISLSGLGNGKIVYYGIPEDASEFKLSPFYPIFWSGLLKFLANKAEIRNLNFKTGDQLVTGASLTQIGFDNVGVYEIGNVKVAANLLNDIESDINKESQAAGISEDYVFGTAKERVRQSISVTLLYLIIVLLLVELIYIKGRGDL